MDAPPQTPGSSSAHGRTRSRGFSFRSDKSGGSKTKSDGVHESPRDKDRRDQLWSGASKANPNAALAEVQPVEANLTEQSTLQNIRDLQHHDQNGQVINEPDLSNPTRPRFERPLDTIRSFEKAIDQGYKRRASNNRPDGEPFDQNNQHASRRSSYYGANEGPNANRYNQGGGGYYGGGPTNGYNSQQRMRYGNRMQSDSQIYGSQRQPYQQHGYNQSYDQYNGGSDSTGPWANSTDPSSENSSFDRMTPMNKPQTPMEGYANGYHEPIMEEQGYGNPHGNPGDNMPGPPNGAPAVQPVNENGARRPIPLGNSGPPPPPPHSTAANLPSMTRPEPPEKRKSWIKRRFSKQ